MSTFKPGKIERVAGPVIVSNGMLGSQMYEVVRVGDQGLIGEIIHIEGEKATVQVYEETAGIRPGETVQRTGKALSVELGPGITGQIYDGIQRPLTVLFEKTGPFVRRGTAPSPIDKSKKWHFVPTISKSTNISGGEVLGTVKETSLITQRILVPPNLSGQITALEDEGDYTVTEPIAELQTSSGPASMFMMHSWPVRTARAFKGKLPSDTPLLTGQRIMDFFFPIVKGGTAAIPGGFGTGKTMMQQQLAKWADASVIVYVGCGERGNEMAEVLETFPKLTDPRTGEPLMNRTILVANTSNMPIAAREASVYTGITIAEYFRDMGYDVALMADSTSRWAEALREISGRLEEMPGEEGYPAYLASRLAEFYERGGKAVVISPEERVGSLTLVGAVSPPGGDFSEPVSQNTLRVTRVFWALDASLASRRHFPSINWLTSYSLYADGMGEWYKNNVAAGWIALRKEALEILQRESELQEIVQLVGYDALPEPEKGVLDTARSIREDYLQQSAYDEVDTYTSIRKQLLMLSAILDFGKMEADAIKKGITSAKIGSIESRKLISKIKWTKEDQVEQLVKEITSKMQQEFADLLTEATR